MPPTSAVPDVGLSSPHSMRMVVDLPAPLAPRKPKISPCFTENDRSSTATNAPKRRVNPRTSIAAAEGADSGVAETSWLMAVVPARVRGALRRGARSASARVRTSSDSSSCTCAIRTSVLVATPAPNRSDHDAAGFGGAPDGIGRRAHHRLARFDVEQPLPDVRRHDRIELRDVARASRSRSAAASAACDFARPKSKKFQLTLTPTSHDSSHCFVTGKMRRFGFA